MVKRVSKQEVVKQPPLVISTNNLDLIFVKDNPDIIKTDAKGLKISSTSSGKFNTGANLIGSPTITATPVLTNVQSGTTILPPDVPNLADIEKIEFEEYPDPLTGIAKYKVIIKMRNNSREKSNVIGVDARIANPNGSVTYTLGTGTASTGSTGTKTSNFISNVTWYNAQSSFDPFGGYILSSPTIVANAQYPSDGSTVPADSTTGPSKNRVKSAWRKTQAEALAAVDLTSMGLI